MLYGIIADIHGNLEALEAVLGCLPRVDRLICVGDIVGYGPNPNECIDLVRKMNIAAVSGNHEKAVVGEIDMQWFNENPKKAVFWTRDNMKPENMPFLKGLPLTLEMDDFQLVHGSLREPLEEYVSSISDAIPTFEMMTKPLCFLGHSHKPLFIGRRNDGNYNGRKLLNEDEIFIEEYEKVIINVGAVGQPRDGDPRASYGIYNSKSKIFSLHRIEYDIKKVQEKMKKAGLPQSLIDRLQRGR